MTFHDPHLLEGRLLLNERKWYGNPRFCTEKRKSLWCQVIHVRLFAGRMQTLKDSIGSGIGTIARVTIPRNSSSSFAAIVDRKLQDPHSGVTGAVLDATINI